MNGVRIFEHIHDAFIRKRRVQTGIRRSGFQHRELRGVKLRAVPRQQNRNHAFPDDRCPHFTSQPVSGIVELGISHQQSFRPAISRRNIHGKMIRPATGGGFEKIMQQIQLQNPASFPPSSLLFLKFFSMRSDFMEIINRFYREKQPTFIRPFPARRAPLPRQ